MRVFGLKVPWQIAAFLSAGATMAGVAGLSLHVDEPKRQPSGEKAAVAHREATDTDFSFQVTLLGAQPLPNKPLSNSQLGPFGLKEP